MDDYFIISYSIYLHSCILSLFHKNFSLADSIRSTTTRSQINNTFETYAVFSPSSYHRNWHLKKRKRHEITHISPSWCNSLYFANSTFSNFVRAFENFLFEVIKCLSSKSQSIIQQWYSWRANKYSIWSNINIHLWCNKMREVTYCTEARKRL